MKQQVKDKIKHQIKGKRAANLRDKLTVFIGEVPNCLMMDVVVKGVTATKTYLLSTPEMAKAGKNIKAPKLPFADRVSKVSVVWDEEGVLTITELEHNGKTVVGSTPNVRPEIAAHRLAK